MSVLVLLIYSKESMCESQRLITISSLPVFPRCPILYTTSHVRQILIYLKVSMALAVCGKTIPCRLNTLTSSNEAEEIYLHKYLCAHFHVNACLEERVAVIFPNYTFTFTNYLINQ